MSKQTKEFLEDFKWLIGEAENEMDFLVGAYELAIDRALEEDSDVLYEIANEIDEML